MSKLNLTPYAAWKIANARIVAAGLPAIRPQMLYNYTSGKVNKGERPLIKWNATDGVDREDLQRWLTSYISTKKGKLGLPTVSDPEQYAFDTTEAR